MFISIFVWIYLNIIFFVSTYVWLLVTSVFDAWLGVEVTMEFSDNIGLVGDDNGVVTGDDCDVSLSATRNFVSDQPN